MYMQFPVPMYTNLHKGSLSKSFDSRLDQEISRQRSLPIVPADYVSFEYRKAWCLSGYGIIKASVSNLTLLREVLSHRLQLPFHNLAEDLDGFIDSASFTENATKTSIWDRVFASFFVEDSLLQYEHNFSMASVHPHYADQSFVVDGVVGVKLMDGRFLPLLHIESVEKEQNIAFVMAQSLLAAIGICRHRIRAKLEMLRVYGLLIRGDEVEVVVMYPIIHEHECGRKLKYDFVYESNSSQWSFNLFLDHPQTEDQASIQPSSPPLSNCICSGSNEEFLFVKGVEYNPELSFITITSNFRTSKNGLSSIIPNRVCLGVIERLKSLLSTQAHLIKNGRQSDMFPDGNYGENDFFNKSNPVKQDFKTFQVRKRRVGNEIAVYKLSVVATSNCFPKLVNFKIAPDSVLLELEQVSPFGSQIKQFRSSNCLEAQITAAQAFVDCTESLKVLHGAGIVHGDVSPFNFGFNHALQRWQLFDFNQSRKLEKAKNVVYHGGTKYFRSKAFEKTGLFYPVDDYVALFKSCTLQLSRRYRRFMEPFLKLEALVNSFSDDREVAEIEAIVSEGTSILEILKNVKN